MGNLRNHRDIKIITTETRGNDWCQIETIIQQKTFHLISKGNEKNTDSHK